MSTPMASRSAMRRSTEVSCGHTRLICAWLAVTDVWLNEASSAAASAASRGWPSARAFAAGTSRCPCASITGLADGSGGGVMVYTSAGLSRDVQLGGVGAVVVAEQPPRVTLGADLAEATPRRVAHELVRPDGEVAVAQVTAGRERREA